MENLVLELTKRLEIPIRSETQNIWLLRTEAGKYYFDFKHNSYVALGWNKVPVSLIQNMDIDANRKREQIQLIYPDEKRPGLILGQMMAFYSKMNKGDIIIIPSQSSQCLSIGILGDLVSNVQHLDAENDYAQCQYEHKRSVEWIRDTTQSTDVYLSKVLKSHQTISNVNEYSSYIYRNMFPIYLEGNNLHLTIHKHSTKELSLIDNYELLSSVIKIQEEITPLFYENINSKDLCLKTAVGSPGFWEFVLPIVSGSATLVSPFVIVSIIKMLIGKTKDESGKIATGINSIIQTVNVCLNDRKERQLKEADIQLKKSEIKINEANVEKIQLENERYKLETEELYNSSGDNTEAIPTDRLISDENISVQIPNAATQQQINSVIENISNSCEQIEIISNSNELRVSS